jgi:hypothetical protein
MAWRVHVLYIATGVIYSVSDIDGKLRGEDTRHTLPAAL